MNSRDDMTLTRDDVTPVRAAPAASARTGTRKRGVAAVVSALAVIGFAGAMVARARAAGARDIDVLGLVSG